LRDHLEGDVELARLRGGDGVADRGAPVGIGDAERDRRQRQRRQSGARQIGGRRADRPGLEGALVDQPAAAEREQGGDEQRAGRAGSGDQVRSSGGNGGGRSCWAIVGAPDGGNVAGSRQSDKPGGAAAPQRLSLL
jgi:hypothetical protein